MARRINHIEAHALDLELFAIDDPHRDDVRFGLLAHDGDAIASDREARRFP